VPRPDLVVIGNKVSRPNAEVQGVPPACPISPAGGLAEFFIAGRRSLVVAGTHGKTTSTAMLAWVLQQAGRDPSLMVGGEPRFRRPSSSARASSSSSRATYDSAFFDKGPKFLHYRPAASSSRRWSSTTPTSTATSKRSRWHSVDWSISCRPEPRWWWHDFPHPRRRRRRRRCAVILVRRDRRRAVEPRCAA
jgi:hypothetical protein